MPEPDIPQKKPRKRGRLLVFATLGVLLACCVPFAWRYYRVAAVQNALERDWEITFNAEERPPGMPQVLDDKLQELLRNMRNKGERGEVLHIIYGERVRAMFRGSITEIHIYYPVSFRGDLGTALLRFGELKKLTVFENEDHLPAEADYKLLCQRLRSSMALEELELGGGQITSDAVAPLAGHPKLKKLKISYSLRLTTDVLRTLKTLPALQTLEVGCAYGPNEDEWKAPALHARFRKELPGVTVTLPES
ncbi:MAG TPA: hypothetical protein VLE43_09035 [Candidatus Saccharimonadia bacterium]|nr:hypothetical protein [Candidatus Saccharimonadia bacterium]